MGEALAQCGVCVFVNLRYAGVRPSGCLTVWVRSLPLSVFYIDLFYICALGNLRIPYMVPYTEVLHCSLV